MSYIQVSFLIKPFEEYISDVLASELGEIGFDSFIASEQGLDAFVLETAFDESKLRNLMADFPFAIYYHLIEEEVVVLAVVHTGRDSNRWKSRI